MHGAGCRHLPSRNGFGTRRSSPWPTLARLEPSVFRPPTRSRTRSHTRCKRSWRRLTASAPRPLRLSSALLLGRQQYALEDVLHELLAVGVIYRIDQEAKHHGSAVVTGHQCCIYRQLCTQTTMRVGIRIRAYKHRYTHKCINRSLYGLEYTHSVYGNQNTHRASA